MTSLSATAQARVGLLGNPSDIYGGRGLGFSVAGLTATVRLDPAERDSLPNELLSASWRRMARELAAAGVDATQRPFALTCWSNIPFQGGLSGSSALVIAALRAWSRWFAAPLSAQRLAELAFEIENDELGIRAGPLDRVVQAHDGLLAMDFARPFADDAATRLDPALLPPMLLAWHGQPGESSGDVHAPIYERWQSGDQQVRDAMRALADNADAGRAALVAGDRAAFLACIDRNFELRASVFTIAGPDRALVELGRAAGAACKLPGSGGAVLMACRDDAHRDQVERACREQGHDTLRPEVQPPSPRLRAVFLAAGFATRLYPLTEKQAKPLLEVAGKPMLTRILAQVARTGALVDGVVVTNGKFHADFESWERSPRAPLPLTVVNDGAMDNDTRLGAIRDLALALERMPPADGIDGYLVMACDNLFDYDLGVLVERFRVASAGQLIVRQVPSPVPPGRYSEVLLDGDRVARFREKPSAPESDLSAIAVYLLPADLPQLVRDYLDGDGNPDAPGHFLAWLSQRLPLEATRLSGRWLDIGSVEDLAKAQAEFED
ncbi:MAG: NTP transferase domain-containing protein [Planctomycetes bacterium]|nr:NTP transferase domain-containing protein [Planctomycetota bacterium]